MKRVSLQCSSEPECGDESRPFCLQCFVGIEATKLYSDGRRAVVHYEDGSSAALTLRDGAWHFNSERVCDHAAFITSYLGD